MNKKNLLILIGFLVVISTYFIYSNQTKCSKADGSICTINIKGNILELEVAYSEKKQAKGLMYINKLDKNKGMIFVYDKSRYLSFWMKNTYIPLSIAYVDKDGFIIDIINMYPTSKNKPNNQIPRYPSSKMVKYAIETNQGWFALRNIRVGDKVKIPKNLN